MDGHQVAGHVVAVRARVVTRPEAGPGHPGGTDRCAATVSHQGVDGHRVGADEAVVGQLLVRRLPVQRRDGRASGVEEGGVQVIGPPGRRPHLVRQQEGEAERVDLVLALPQPRVVGQVPRFVAAAVGLDVEGVGVRVVA